MLRTRALQTHLRLEVAAIVCLTVVCGSIAARAFASTAQPTDQSPAELGRKIFFDASLSASGQMACSSCHDPRYAYGPPPGKGIAKGGAHLDRPGTRAVPSLRYLHGAPKFSETTRFADGDVGPGGGFTWDGRAGTLKDQARIPLLAANEMANRSPAEVVAKLGRSAYAPEFRETFGADIFEHPERAFEAALSALDAFQQIPKEFYPFNSKYDAFLRGELELSEQEERGANPNIALRDAFWSVITRYNATYFCGHEHIPNVQKFSDPTTASEGAAYQVIVGSGGSPFGDKLSGTCPSCTKPVLANPYDRFYAWALVQVHKSGNVSLNLYGFSDDFGPTQKLRNYSVESLQ